MTTRHLPNPVPLGVSESTTIPLARYESLGSGRPAVLLTDDERSDYIAERLNQAIDRPLTSPGSHTFARQVLAQFRGTDLLRPFAEKALETLRDGQPHNRTAMSPIEPRLAVMFVAWRGSHRQLQVQRFGNYLKPLAATATRFIQSGFNLAGILEIDAYVRDTSEPDEPFRSLDEVFEIDVEFSYLPGPMLGSSGPAQPPFSRQVMLNPDLFDEEERQLLDKLMIDAT